MARAPHRNSTRTDWRIFSILRSSTAPISPVARTCVPPQALRSRPVDGDDAQRALALGRLAQPAALGGILESQRRAGGFRRPPGWRGARPRPRRAASSAPPSEIDGGALGAQVEADGAQCEQFLENGGEQVLAGVLLHVVEAAGPIDGAFDRSFAERGRAARRAGARCARLRRRRRRTRSAADRAGVEGLAAGGGIKGGAVEIDGEAVGGSLHRRAR